MTGLLKKDDFAHPLSSATEPPYVKVTSIRPPPYLAATTKVFFQFPCNFVSQFFTNCVEEV